MIASVGVVTVHVQVLARMAGSIDVHLVVVVSVNRLIVLIIQDVGSGVAVGCPVDVIGAGIDIGDVLGLGVIGIITAGPGFHRP